MNLEKWNKAIFMVVFAILCSVAIGVFGFINKGSNPVYPSIPTTTSARLFKVDVKGEVKNPGVYSLDADKRVLDAIALAGGTTEVADMSNVNLSAFLKDGQAIKVPKISHPKPTKQKKTLISNPKEKPKPTPKATSSNEKATPIPTPSDDKININTASKEEFSSLPALNDELIEKIIAFRDKKGEFKVLGDILKVPGISESIFWQFIDYIKIK